MVDSKERLWARLTANPDELTDLRIIFAEWVNTRAKLESATATSHRGPPVQYEFATFDEREAYFKLVKDAQQWRAHTAALQETLDSLVQQLRMMTNDLPLESLDDLLREIGG